MLLDTSGLLCLHHQAETLHDDALAAWRKARTGLTHSNILAEFVALAHVRRLPRLPALTFVGDLLDTPNVETVWVDEVLHREAAAMLLARLDKSYSPCDAVSFILMRSRKLSDALTTDHHFEQEGFRRLLG